MSPFRYIRWTAVSRDLNATNPWSMTYQKGPERFAEDLEEGLRRGSVQAFWRDRMMWIVFFYPDVDPSTQSIDFNNSEAYLAWEINE